VPPPCWRDLRRRLVLSIPGEPSLVIFRVLPSAGIMLKIKSFQRRILIALFGVGLVPAALLLLAGTFLLRMGVDAAGTAGPWVPVAESGQALLDAIQTAKVPDSAVARTASAHEQALSEGLRFSGIFSLVASRIFSLLPLLALGLAILIGGLSFWVARQLSRGFSRPIRDLVAWTELIGKGEPLPPVGPADSRGVQEFMTLRESLRSMAHEIEEGRDQAVQAARLRSWTEMARRVAHELKNPLTPMRMAASTVARLEDPSAREAGEVLLEEIGRLDEMARAFSQFGRMPEGPPSDVDLHELLQLLLQQHSGAGTTFRLSTPGDIPLVRAHYDALQRALRNLLLNAIQAAGPDGLVQVSLQAEAQWVRVLFHDSGPGIPESDLELIWEPDYSTKSSGTGLGLPMVKQTILAHRGRVEGKNHPEGGAMFVVELPLFPST